MNNPTRDSIGWCRHGTRSQRSALEPTPVAKVTLTHFRVMPRNIIHSDVSMDPESESEALSIAPDVEEEPEVELEEEDEGEGEGDDEDDEGEDAEDAEEGEDVEEEEVDDAEEEREDEEAADDGDGDAVQEVRTRIFLFAPLKRYHLSRTVGPG